MYHNCSAPGPLACGVPYTCCVTTKVGVIIDGLTTTSTSTIYAFLVAIIPLVLPVSMHDANCFCLF